MATKINTRHVSYQDWLGEGISLFGPNPMDWKFVCPACGHVASVAEYKSAGDNELSMAGFSCIGRLTGAKRGAFAEGAGPCNYAGGGLFRLNPVVVQKDDGKSAAYFEFAANGQTPKAVAND